MTEQPDLRRTTDIHAQKRYDAAIQAGAALLAGGVTELMQAKAEIATLRAQLAGVREKAEYLLGFSLIGEGAGFRPDGMSFVTPLEFHQHTTHAMRDLLAALDGAT